MQPGIVLDFDRNGQVVGIEILGLSARFGPESLRVVQVDTT